MKASYNRLIHEKSSYLLGHAYNPVDWYPWAEEAFLAAKENDKPIFLSIGYASCHWCHVMERESFCDLELAKLLNETFVCVKVDKEELPQVDALYMDFAQMIMASSGGWPLNIVLTPDLKPFYAMTYLPARSSQGMMGLFEMTTHIKKLWLEGEKKRIYFQAEQICQMYKHIHQELLQIKQAWSKELFEKCVNKCLESFDPVYGGKKGAPKFPLSFQCEFLLEYGRDHHHQESTDLALLTLNMMKRGGIYDHIGGGFSRYSVDDKWMIPHFEKILSDNALLAKTYLEGYLWTQDKDLLSTTTEILAFLKKEMYSQEGLFYSSIDADTEGVEGLFYLWDSEEIFAKLEHEDAVFFSEFYHLTKEGNFQGKNVLFQHQSLAEFAKAKKINKEILEQKFSHIKHFLLHERNYRSHPNKDKKFILSWNALALSAFLEAGFSLNDPDFLKIASTGYEKLKTHFLKENTIYRRYSEGEAKHLATLEDVVFWIRLSLNFYKYGYGSSYYDFAKKLLYFVYQDFKAEDEGFYESSVRDSSLLLRRKDTADSSLPAASAVLAEILYLFSVLELEERYQKEGLEILNLGLSVTSEYPCSALSHLHATYKILSDRLAFIVVILDEEQTLKTSFLEWLRQQPQTRFFCLWKLDNLDNNIPYLKDKHLVDGQTSFYVCHKKRCFPPVLNIEDLKRVISHL